MKRREPPPTRVLCHQCRTEIPAALAFEVILCWSPKRGGTLGGADVVTTTSIWACKTHIGPFPREALIRLADELHRPATTQQAGLALGGGA